MQICLRIFVNLCYGESSCYKLQKEHSIVFSLIHILLCFLKF